MHNSVFNRKAQGLCTRWLPVCFPGYPPGPLPSPLHLCPEGTFSEGQCTPPSTRRWLSRGWRVLSPRYVQVLTQNLSETLFGNSVFASAGKSC